MKKLLFAFLFSLILSVAAYATEPTVNVNGKSLENVAVIQNSRTLVGVRCVFEELGYDVEWDDESSTATLKNEQYTITLKNGENTFTVNDKVIEPDVPQQIINSRFYLPLRAIAEAIDANVSWDKESETAIIKTEISETSTEEVTSVTTQQEPTIDEATAGVHTIKNLLLTGLKPVGKTMYIYGGGWNEEDTGAGVEAVAIGISPQWLDFSAKQNSNYNYQSYDYKNDVSVIHLGLDCSGYIGWALYNTINSQNDLDGLVFSSKTIAKRLADWGWGELTTRGNFSDYKAGDIMSASCNDCAHVWMCVGQCSDGSVVFLHSSPPGVMISGTYTPQGGKNSQAIALASKYMQTYYPDWYNKYPDSSRNTSYLTHYDRFRWNNTKLTDPDNLMNMSADEVLKNIFIEG